MKRVSAPPRLPARRRDANKVTVGRVLVVGGSPALRGAPAMAGLGALRAGAGLVKIAVPAPVQDAVAGYRPETTTQGLPATRSGALGAAALPVLRELAPGWDAVVLGPGAGRWKATIGLMRSFTLWVRRPLVIDADGLFAWNEDVAPIANRADPTVLTPHEGEAARLLGTTSAAVRADRLAAAETLANASGAVVVLKGPDTIVTDGRRLYRNKSGGPVLATGGSGDVLAGVIGALLATAEDTGLDAFQAACAGVYVHGDGADRVAGDRDRGLLASELAGGIPASVRSLRKGASR